MRLFIYSIVVTLLVCIHATTIPTPSYANTQCNEGLQQCKKYKNTDPIRYAGCVRTTCLEQTAKPKPDVDAVITNQNINTEDLHTPSVQFEEDEKTATEVETCEIGQFKCNSLRDEPLYYWRCMKVTCDGLTGNEDATCEEGQDYCKFLMDGYWLCMSISCGTRISDFETCPSGEDKCSPDLNKYWNCVSNQCLGSVDEFRNPDPESILDDSPYKDNIVQNPAAALRATSAFRVQGVRPKNQFPPKGIDPRTWAKKVEPARSVIGNASRILRCGDYTKSVTCRDTRDIGSCMCADGSRPIIRKEFRKTQPPRRWSGK